MSIIVDKDKKRRDIAISCTNLLLDKGIKNLKISEIAIAAGIGKGTIYDYFRNKEEIVFEIIRNLIAEHQQDLLSRSNHSTSCKQKVLYLFDFFLCEYKNYQQHLDLYKEYLSVTLSLKVGAMHEFNRECTNFLKISLESIIHEGIEKGEVKPVAIDLVYGMMAAERGFMMISWSEDKSLKQDFKNHIYTLFDLIEIKQ